MKNLEIYVRNVIFEKFNDLFSFFENNILNNELKKQLFVFKYEQFYNVVDIEKTFVHKILIENEIDLENFFDFFYVYLLEYLIKLENNEYFCRSLTNVENKAILKSHCNLTLNAEERNVMLSLKKTIKNAEEISIFFKKDANKKFKNLEFYRLVDNYMSDEVLTKNELEEFLKRNTCLYENKKNIMLTLEEKKSVKCNQYHIYNSEACHICNTVSTYNLYIYKE